MDFLNKYQISDDGTHVIGRTTKGVMFYFDVADQERIKANTWFFTKRGYVATHIKRKVKTMHRFLIGDISGMDVDHINGNKLDNRRSNLRICTHQENMFNQKKRSTNTTGYMGVSYMKRADRYEAYVHYSGKKHYIGLFHKAVDAAKARDKKASLLFGTYARLNFPQKRTERSG
jgi:hypothetical protein